MLCAFKLFGHLGDLDNIEFIGGGTTPVDNLYANYWFFMLGN